MLLMREKGVKGGDDICVLTSDEAAVIYLGMFSPDTEWPNAYRPMNELPRGLAALGTEAADSLLKAFATNEHE